MHKQPTLTDEELRAYKALARAAKRVQDLAEEKKEKSAKTATRERREIASC